MKVSLFLRQWHDGRKPLLRQCTFEAEGVYIGCHLAPYFDKCAPELEALTAMDVYGYMTYKLAGGREDGKAGGLSRVSVAKHLSILRKALNEAVIFGLIDRNPAEAVRLPRGSTITERTVFLDPQDVQRLFNGLAGHPIYPAVVLAFFYGLRRSEVLGLRWDAIDFEHNTIQIFRTVVKNLTVVDAETTKTATSRRTFQLLPEVRALLLDLKSTAPPGSVHLFCHSDGSLWRPDVLTRSFQRQLKRLGFPIMRFHDLRHSTASLLFDRGWSLEDVKNWLGHADIETTSNIYLHYKASRRVLVARDLEGVFQLTKKENVGGNSIPPTYEKRHKTAKKAP